MSENSSALYSVAQSGPDAPTWVLTPDRTAFAVCFQLLAGFGLIMATVWTGGITQRILFWSAAAWFAGWGMLSLRKKDFDGFHLPSARTSALMLLSALLLAGGLVLGASGLGTLHGLFGTRDPLRHATGYICWAIIQQYIQQCFFFSRFKQLTHRTWLASFSAAFLFGVAHLPNPILAPVTFLGGWLLSELYSHYRTVLPLGIGHGMIGIAIAVSVPDHLQHHMRVGLSFLHYIG